MSRNHREIWNRRIQDVLSCPDNQSIPRVPNAGDIQRGCQIMHNGIKVAQGSYYGIPVEEMLRKNQGVHEPQEERVFNEVLKHINSGSVMVELGAYWSFYSMWFKKEVKNSVCYMIEADDLNLSFGKRNFKINQMQGKFFHAYIGAASGLSEDDVKITCIDDFVAEQKIDYIDILHSDIQGFELDMLKGAYKTIRANKVGYVFISTHSNDLHKDCETYLINNEFQIIASANVAESYSEDGILVAKSKSAPAMDTVNIAKKH